MGEAYEYLKGSLRGLSALFLTLHLRGGLHTGTSYGL